MKQLLKSVIARTPYRVTRASALNRFDATAETLAGLSERGFLPTRIVDGGANVGDFTRMAQAIFPGAKFDLVEPQAACIPALRKLAQENGYKLHEVALVSPGAAGRRVALQTTPGAVTTGAHILPGATHDGEAVRSATLDSLILNCIGPGEHILLKLDLQGYELEALSGAEETLRSTEVILTEVSFFAQSYEPPIAELMAWLNRRDFVLYDISALSARARDGRVRQGDFVFVHRSSALMADGSWA